MCVRTHMSMCFDLNHNTLIEKIWLEKGVGSGGMMLDVTDFKALLLIFLLKLHKAKLL